MGLSAIVYGMGLSVIKIPDSRTHTLKVSDWPGKLTGLSGTFTDRPAKVSDWKMEIDIILPVFMSADLSVSWHYVVTLRRGRTRTRPREQLLLQNYKA